MAGFTKSQNIAANTWVSLAAIIAECGKNFVLSAENAIELGWTTGAAPSSASVTGIAAGEGINILIEEGVTGTAWVRCPSAAVKITAHTAGPRVYSPASAV